MKLQRLRGQPPIRFWSSPCYSRRRPRLPLNGPSARTLSDHTPTNWWLHDSTKCKCREGEGPFPPAKLFRRRKRLFDPAAWRHPDFRDDFRGMEFLLLPTERIAPLARAAGIQTAAKSSRSRLVGHGVAALAGTCFRQGGHLMPGWFKKPGRISLTEINRDL